MRTVIAGSSGYLGGALTERLRAEGHDVIRLVRREARGDDEVEWDPYRRPLDPEVLTGADAVVNLCGAGVGDRRWTPAYKGLIRASRTEPTRVLAEAVAEARVPVLLNGSAVGVYGDPGPSEVDETAPPAEDFLGKTVQLWEGATRAAADAGTRVAMLRTGHVFGPDAVMLKRLLPVFRLGLGGRFGSGEQYLPWIALDDWVSAVVFLLGRGDVEGPVNLVGPTPVTNGEFAKALGGVLGKPVPFVVPGFALRVAVGEAATELLRGARVRPRRLEDAGFVWEHASMTDTLRWALDRRDG